MRIGRILAVTGTLALLGCLAGAIGACLVILVVVVVRGWPADPEFTIWFVLGIASIIGGVLGIVAAPILSWTLLRRVPIWRSATETALAAGIVATSALVLAHGNLPITLAATIMAALLAAARLRWSFRNDRTAVELNTAS